MTELETGLSDLANKIQEAQLNFSLTGLFYELRDKTDHLSLEASQSLQSRLLTVGGAAAGSITRTVPHLNSLPSHFQQVWIRQAGLARVPKSLLVVAPIVRDVDRCPGCPGCGLFQLRAWVGITRLVLLEEKTHEVCLSYCRNRARGILP